MSEMDKYINNLVSEFKRLSYEDVGNCSNTEKLLYLYAYYHYFNQTVAKYLILFRATFIMRMHQIE